MGWVGWGNEWVGVGWLIMEGSGWEKWRSQGHQDPHRHPQGLLRFTIKVLCEWWVRWGSGAGVWPWPKASKA